MTTKLDIFYTNSESEIAHFGYDMSNNQGIKKNAVCKKPRFFFAVGLTPPLHIAGGIFRTHA